MRSFTVNSVVLFLMAPALWPAGALEGQVTDRNFGVLPGAAVTLTYGKPPVTRTVTTDQVGRYTFKDVPRGDFQLTVTFKGFLTTTLQGSLDHRMGSTVINPVLQVDPTIGEVWSFNLIDRDNLLPPYHSFFLDNQVTGELTFSLSLKGGRVEKVDRSSVRLNSPLNFEERHPELVENQVKRIEGTVSKWRTARVNDFYSGLTVQFELDSGLDFAERNYLLTFGDNGLITEMRISGPVIPLE